MAAKKEVVKAAPKQKQPLSVALNTKLAAVSNALPKDFNKSRFVQNALALLNDHPELGNFGQAQIVNGLMKGAYLGLDFFAKEAYLIPYGSQLQFQTDYKGEVKLARKYSTRPIKEIYAAIVREGDQYEEWIDDGERHFRHTVKPFSNGSVIGAYAICRFEDGGFAFDSMSQAELEKTRSKSKAKNSMAWADFTAEMYKKTVLRRLCKQITIDFETVEQRQAFQEDADMLTPEKVRDQDIEEYANAEEFIDGEAEEIEVVEAEPSQKPVEAPREPQEEDLPPFLRN